MRRIDPSAAHWAPTVWPLDPEPRWLNCKPARTVFCEGRHTASVTVEAHTWRWWKMRKELSIRLKIRSWGAALKLMGDDEAERNGERAADVAVSVLCLYLGAMSPRWSHRPCLCPPRCCPTLPGDSPWPAGSSEMFREPVTVLCGHYRGPGGTGGEASNDLSSVLLAPLYMLMTPSSADL